MKKNRSLFSLLLLICYYLNHIQPYLFILFIFLLLSLSNFDNFLFSVLLPLIFLSISYNYLLLTLSFLRTLSELATDFIQNNLQQDENLNYVAALEDLIHRFPVLVFQVWIKSNFANAQINLEKFAEILIFIIID